MEVESVRKIGYEQAEDDSSGRYIILFLIRRIADMIEFNSIHCEIVLSAVVVL